MSLLIIRRLALPCALLAAASAFAQYEESITVARILIDVRVTDPGGSPVLGLTPKDFDVRIGEKHLEIESVDWVDESVPVEVPAAASAGQTAESNQMDLPLLSSGRLFVVFIQTDFARNGSRVAGSMHFRRYAEEMVRSLQPDDRVAVFSFDSHLKFRLDFTRDKEAVIAAMRDAIHIDDPPSPPAVTPPSLASHLDAEAMREAADSERGLALVAEALLPIDGPKTLLLMGWGLGELVVGRGTMQMKPQWMYTRMLLAAAHVTIFSLDTTIADYHDLEIGLAQAAEETGGFYVKTHQFGQAAISRLLKTLKGHYEITLRRPNDLGPGTHTLHVDVKRRGVVVLAPLSWRTVG